MYLDTWLRLRCHCKAINWVCIGDTSDVTVPDSSGYVCWKCGKSEHYELGDHCDLDALLDDGREYPS